MKLVLAFIATLCLFHRPCKASGDTSQAKGIIIYCSGYRLSVTGCNANYRLEAVKDGGIWYGEVLRNRGCIDSNGIFISEFNPDGCISCCRGKTFTILQQITHKWGADTKGIDSNNLNWRRIDINEAGTEASAELFYIHAGTEDIKDWDEVMDDMVRQICEQNALMNKKKEGEK